MSRGPRSPQRVLLALCLAALCGAIATPALARPGRVALTSGEIADVDVVGLEPGKQVTVRLADGTERVLPWEWIVSVELAAPAAAAPVAAPTSQPVLTPQPAPGPVLPAASAPVLAPAPAPSPALVAPPTAASEAVKLQRIKLLETEIKELEASAPTLLAPALVSAVGLGGGMLGILVALSMEVAAEEAYEAPPDNEALLAVSGVALVAGLGGLVWLLVQSSQSSDVDQQVRAKTQELDTLKAGVVVGPTGAAATLRWVL